MSIESREFNQFPDESELRFREENQELLVESWAKALQEQPGLTTLRRFAGTYHPEIL